MKPGIKCIGRIAVWGFAGLGVIYTGLFISLWAKENVPGGRACKITEYEELTPGSPQYKAAELVRQRAMQKYPNVDFSKRELKIPIYEWEKHSPVWTVTYDEPGLKTFFGCERFRLDDHGVRISGQVGKRDLILQGDIVYESY